MDYEKLYKETIDKLRKLHNDWYSTQNRAAKEIESVFPELCESEDERIRKSILELVKQSNHILNPMNQKSMIVWLEKQKKVDQKFKIGDTVCRKFYEDHTIKRIYYDCNDPVYVCKNEEGLESHIPFSEQDEWTLKETTNVKATKDTSNKAEELIRYLPYCEDISDDTKKRWIDYLKTVIDGWRPTEEQMGALNYAYCELFSRGENGEGSGCVHPLMTLIDDLKKL